MELDPNPDQPAENRIERESQPVLDIPDIPIRPIELKELLNIVDIPIAAIQLGDIVPASKRSVLRFEKKRGERLGGKALKGTRREKSIQRIKYRPASIRGRPAGARYKEGKKGRKQGKRGGPSLLRNFAACPRCSYFLSGYRVLYGREVVDKLDAEQIDGWLGMEWTIETRRLLHRSYGIRTDIDHYFWEHACETCCRRIVFEMKPERDPNGGPTSGGPLFLEEDFFWVEVKSKR